MPTLDAIRSAGEADIEKLLKQLDTRHKKILRDAIKKYGSVQNIPESIWQEIENNVAEGTAAAVFLLLMMADDWTTAEIKAQGAPRRRLTDAALTDYSLSSARQAAALASQTTDTLRNRLTRKLQDQALSTRGGVGETTDEGIDEALEDVFTQSRRETMAVDATTQAMSAGQMGARDRHEDGGKLPFTIALIWKTEADFLVCPRCAPLEGQPEEVWGRVFPNGPGPAAHPRCRCELEVRVVPVVEDSE